MARELITPEENVTTADLLKRPAQPESASKPLGYGDHELLFPNADSEDLRRRWTDIQASFVDEPKSSVEKADQLVASAIQKLTQVFADERSKLERCKRDALAEAAHAANAAF